MRVSMLFNTIKLVQSSIHTSFLFTMEMQVGPSQEGLYSCDVFWCFVPLRDVEFEAFLFNGRSDSKSSSINFQIDVLKPSNGSSTVLSIFLSQTYPSITFYNSYYESVSLVFSFIRLTSEVRCEKNEKITLALCILNTFRIQVLNFSSETSLQKLKFNRSLPFH